MALFGNEGTVILDCFDALIVNSIRNKKLD